MPDAVYIAFMLASFAFKVVVVMFAFGIYRRYKHRIDRFGVANQELKNWTNEVSGATLKMRELQAASMLSDLQNFLLLEAAKGRMDKNTADAAVALAEATQSVILNGRKPFERPKSAPVVPQYELYWNNPPEESETGVYPGKLAFNEEPKQVEPLIYNVGLSFTSGENSILE